MLGAHDFPALIQELHSELNHDGAVSASAAGAAPWQTRVHEIALGKLQSPYEFLEWARRDRHWSFTLAEVMSEVCSKPSELAVRLLIAILEELRDEEQIGISGSG